MGVESCIKWGYTYAQYSFHIYVTMEKKRKNKRGKGKEGKPIFLVCAAN